jgi:pyruvate/2-oxoglutarate dehydrogenase complex dihydrolipoamide dehydrogenase (E3) component
MTAAFPVGPHDERLVGAVHPPDWVNPPPKPRYHLVVVGAGTAGLVSAAAAAGMGARVALVERHLMGGDCLNVGCVPSKAILAAARRWADARETAERYHGPAVSGGGDFAAVMDRMRRLRADIAPIDGAARFRDLGVDVFLGEGRFTGPDSVQVGEATLRFRRGVIATGARAAAPPIPGLAEGGYFTNETIWNLTELPAHLLVIGAGPIGCEMAQAFARFGSAVTVVDMSPRILPRDDADAAGIVHAAMTHDGVTFALGVAVKEVRRDGATVHVTVERDGTRTTLTGTHLLVAAGRAPNVEGLGLEAAGVRFSKQGVETDDRLRTSNPKIFAVGDVAGRHQFTHAADFHARTVLANALFFGRSRVSKLVIPWATYTSPEVAHVGETAEQLTKEKIPFETITVPMHDNDRAILEGETAGFLKVHLEGKTDRILGATIVAPHAGDLIGEMTLAITNGLGLGAFAKTIHPYPTTAEAFRKAGDQWNRRKLTALTRRLLRGWFSVFG